MASENEPAKLLLPYLQRADELQKHEPLVSYYCRLYAMERGMKIPQGERTKTTNALLVSLMNQLEKDKKSLKLGPDDHLHLEGFALNVFAKADKQDRAGRADLSTAKTFYAASIFFEILNQFGEVQPDLEQKQKYAAWKAADIRKALKEGRKPEPGAPADDKDLSISSSTPSGAHDLGLSRTDSATNHGPESDQSPQIDVKAPQSPHFDDKYHSQQSTNIPPSISSYPSSSYSSQDFQPPPSISQSPHFDDKLNNRQPNIPPSPSYSTASYSPQDFQAPPPSNRPENFSTTQPYYHHTYSQEPQLPHPYESTSSINSYPNFQSYPSFTESSLPTAPSHYPSFNQSSETSFSPHSAPSVTTYPDTVPHKGGSTNGPYGSMNGAVSDPLPTSAQTYQHDPNYLPPPEKIAEAHKAARFAVGALAFDDVSVAVEFLRTSLELLTNPSAGAQ